ncbi:hypothetical protein ES708_28787 [subsurface metagenome]
MKFFKSYENERQFIINTHSIPLINTVKPEEVITAKCNMDGSSTFSNVTNIKELKRKLRQGYIVFSDLLLLEQEDEIDEVMQLSFCKIIKPRLFFVL